MPPRLSIPLLLLTVTTISRSAAPLPAAGVDFPVDDPVYPISTLLDPRKTPADSYEAFRVISRTDGGWAAVPALLRQTASPDPALRRRADWALWCLLDANDYRLALSIGPCDDAAFAAAIVKRGLGSSKSARAMADSPSKVLSDAGKQDLRAWPPDPEDVRSAIAHNQDPSRRPEFIPRARRNAGVVSDLEMRAGRGYRAFLGKGQLILKHLHSEDPAIRAAARACFDEMFDKGILTRDGAEELAMVAMADSGANRAVAEGMLIESQGEARERAIGIASHAALSGSLGLLPARGVELLKELHADLTPQIQAVIDVERSFARGDDLLASWLAATGNKESSKQAAWESILKLSKVLSSDNLRLRLFVAYLARRNDDAAALETAASAQTALLISVRAGVSQPPDVINALRLDPASDSLRAGLRNIISPNDSNHRADPPAPEVQLAALTVYAVIKVPPADLKTRDILHGFLKHPLSSYRIAAAEALDDPAVLKAANAVDIIADLRRDEYPVRVRAARRAQELNLAPTDFTAALVRATESRDMAAREGLTLALERAQATGKPAQEILKLADAEQDPVSRAYLRAAARALNDHAR